MGLQQGTDLCLQAGQLQEAEGKKEVMQADGSRQPRRRVPFAGWSAAATKLQRVELAWVTVLPVNWQAGHWPLAGRRSAADAEGWSGGEPDGCTVCKSGLCRACKCMLVKLKGCCQPVHGSGCIVWSAAWQSAAE